MLGLFVSFPSAAKCIKQLKDAITAHNELYRRTPRDVRVIEINDAWNEAYSPQRFQVFVAGVLRRTPEHFKEKVALLLKALDEQAQAGRIKNVNEWLGNVAHSHDAPVMSFMAEAEYALFVLKQNERYVVTFEPDGGFYKGDPDQVARLRMKQKSIDLRISDSVTGQVVALREVKSSGGRASVAANIYDAFEKVRLVHHLQVPELSGERPVEVGLVYLYDFDPNFDSYPDHDHSFYWLKDNILNGLAQLQKEHKLPEKPFDTVTFMDFGSRRILYIKRLADDTLEVCDFAMPQDAFISIAPKISAQEALELRNYLLGPVRR